MAASSSSSKSDYKQQLMHFVSRACKETLKALTQLQKFSERAPNSTTRLSFRHPHNQCFGVVQPLNFSPAPRTPQNFGSCFVETFDNVGCRMMTSISKMVCKSSMSSMVKAMVDESIRVSRKAQARHESWLQSQEKLLTAWLNGLLKKPMKQPQPPRIVTQACPTPKPPKIRSLRPPPTPENFLGKLPVLTADSCLKDVCGLAELKQRLALYMDAASVNDLVFSIFKIATCVDDGRLRIKENCAIITDVGLKNKAIKVMMNYNPVWLRLGLHVVLGYSDLAPLEPLKLGLEKPINERTAATDEEFLKLVTEKNFFAHPGLAKTYAFNKGVDGLYRQGYYEALGKVFLKRFLLFVMTLDKIKKESAYPIDQGIDGLDGGSPLLFCRNSWVKSSRQALHEFLSNVMYGEGDVVSHLAMLGYQVSHVQSPLSEYDFHVSNLMENIQDGVILCRLAQILCQDTSVVARIKLPCDDHKKTLHNCNVALEYFLQAGVPLKDEEGMHITAENVVYGDREKILSFLWSIFIELQMPLLISKEKLKEEIFRIKGCEDTEMEMSLNSHGTMEMMLQWIKVSAHCLSEFRNATVLIQSCCRCWLAMKEKKANDLLAIQNRAATKIQCYWRKGGHQSKYRQLKNATILIQSYLRGWLARKTFLSYLSSAVMIQSSFRMYRHRKLFMLYKKVATIMQSIIQMILALQQGRVLHCTNPVNHTPAAVTIQAHIRGWLHRKAFSKATKSAICIQAHWRGYKVRCNPQQQISALRARIKTSASNVDKSHCLEDRLTAALEALLHCKSLRGSLRICNTLDLATQHSRQCCEKLVEVGAIDKILQVIRSANRSTPFEEVLKHALSVLSNIAGHQDLAPFIINTLESVNTVAENLMRNNNQVFCKAAQVLKKLCAVQGGAEALHKLPLFIRRLMQLSQSLEKKLQTQKRNLERLNQKACAPTVKMAENKWKNMLLQHQLITELLQLIQRKPIPSPCAKARRYSVVPKVPSSVP